MSISVLTLAAKRFFGSDYFQPRSLASFFLTFSFSVTVAQELNADVQIMRSKDGNPYSLILKVHTVGGDQVLLSLDSGAPISIINSNILLLDGARVALNATTEKNVPRPEFLGDTLQRTAIRLRGKNEQYVFTGAHIEKSQLGILTGILGNDHLLAKSWRLDLDSMKFQIGIDLSNEKEKSQSFRIISEIPLSETGQTRRFFFRTCIDNPDCPQVMFDTGIARYDFVSFQQALTNVNESIVTLGTPLGTAQCAEETVKRYAVEPVIPSEQLKTAKCSFSAHSDFFPKYHAMGIRTLIEKRARIEFDSKSRRLIFSLAN